MRENRVKAENRCKCVLKVLSKMKTKTKREGRGEKDQFTYLISNIQVVKIKWFENPPSNQPVEP